MNSRSKFDVWIYFWVKLEWIVFILGRSSKISLSSGQKFKSSIIFCDNITCWDSNRAENSVPGLKFGSKFKIWICVVSNFYVCIDFWVSIQHHHWILVENWMFRWILKDKSVFGLNFPLELNILIIFLVALKCFSLLRGGISIVGLMFEWKIRILIEFWVNIQCWDSILGEYSMFTMNSKSKEDIGIQLWFKTQCPHGFLAEK